MKERALLLDDWLVRVTDDDSILDPRNMSKTYSRIEDEFSKDIRLLMKMRVESIIEMHRQMDKMRGGEKV